ncbi:MAG: alpha/beta fold hydrolase, partial [Bryobacteraceae bacterium]
MRQGWITVEGGAVWYKIAGAGERTPLLALHGGPGYPHDYLAPLEALSDERPVVFYDQLGCGRSGRPQNDPSLWVVERFVRELARVREALGLGRVHLFGHSWGSMLAVDALLDGARGVDSLVLASPALSIPRWLSDAARLRLLLPAHVQAVLEGHEAAGTTG